MGLSTQLFKETFNNAKGASSATGPIPGIPNAGQLQREASAKLGLMLESKPFSV